MGSTTGKAAFLQHGTLPACEHPVRACCQASGAPAEDAMGAVSCNERPIFALSSSCSQRACTISSADAFSRLMDSATSWLAGLFLGPRLHSICRRSLCQWHMAQQGLPALFYQGGNPSPRARHSGFLNREKVRFLTVTFWVL